MKTEKEFLEKEIKEEKTKICSKCNKEQPISHFYKDYTLKNNYRSQCKKCVSKSKKIKPKSKHEIIGSNIFWYDINSVEDERYCKKKAEDYLDLLRTKLPYGIFKQLNYLFLQEAKILQQNWEVKFKKWV